MIVSQLSEGVVPMKLRAFNVDFPPQFVWYEKLIHNCLTFNYWCCFPT